MSLPNWERDAKRFAVPSLQAMSERHPVDQLPRLPRHIVERPRLLEALDAWAPLTLIRAPLGFGKTTLVVDWLRRTSASGAVLAWMTVDADSQDSDGFWGELVDTLADAGLHANQDRATRSLRGRAERMIRASARPVLLVIDRFEAVRAEGLDRELIDLVRSTPKLHVVACLRTHRHFPPSALIDIDTTTIDAQDLLLTAAEAQSLLAGLDLDPSENEIETLMKHGGGWPEPTRAAALALAAERGSRDVARITDAVGAQYLRARLLPEAHRPELVRFAILTAIPHSFTAQTAALLTGERSPDALLTRLEEQGFLSATTSTNETVFRWPEAGRQALLAELRRQLPAARIDGLRSELARWYLDHDHAEAALIQAVDALDWPLAIAVVEKSWRVLLTEHSATLRKALIATPRENIASSARAVAVRDIMLRGPDELLAQVARRSPAQPAAGSSTAELNEVLDASMAIMIALRRRGRFADAHDYAERVQAAVPMARFGHPAAALTGLSSLSLQIGVSELLEVNLAGAVGPLTFAWETSRDDPRAFIERDSAGKIALAHAMGGDIRLATKWLKRHDRAGHPDGFLEQFAATTGAIAQALVALERPHAAVSVAAAAVDDLSDAEVIDEFWAYLEYAIVQCAIDGGDWSGMLARLDRARQTHRHWLTPDAVARPLLASAEADLLMAAGRGNEALSVLESTQSDHELVRVGRARLALLTGDTDTAAMIGADGAWQRSASTRTRVEMLLIAAVAAERTAHSQQADRLLMQAMSAASHAGLRRPFQAVPRDELAAIAARLPEITDVVKDVLRSSRQRYPARVRMVTLSERERLVLEQAADGLTIQQIAQALFVSANTVKSQLKSLYRKLDVSTRPDAVARALSWGILTPAPRTPSPQNS
jgi:LuxR family maltose regulon positive regulatory protein